MKAETKKFSMSYADLAMFTSNLVVTITRDSAEFAARGVNAAAITAFEALGNSFEVFPTDEFYVGAIQIEVDAKNASRDAATDKIQYISGYIEQKWGLDSGEYKQLRIHNLQPMSDNNFLVAARAVVSVAALYIADLTPIGLTQADVDALDAETQTYEDKMNSVAEKKKLRDDKARERVDLANELYDYVALYCKIGKLIWENVNEAKYNDYVIYSAGTGGGGGGSETPPAAPANLQYNETTGEFSWSAAAYATSYQLQYKAVTEEDWDEAYSGSDTSVVFDPGAGNWNFRVRARNAAGYGDFSNVIEVNISGALIPPVNVQVTYDEVTQVMILSWLAVPGANSYKVYNSESTIGQPAGTWFYCFNPSGTTVNVVFTVGKRNWYRVTTVIGTEESEPSEEVYYDLPA